MNKPVLIDMMPQWEPAFKLWIKFKDGNICTFKSRETIFTQSQAWNRPELVIDFRKGYRMLIRLVEENYKGKYDLARIYLVKSNEVIREYRKGQLFVQGDPTDQWWEEHLPSHVVQTGRKQAAR